MTHFRGIVALILMGLLTGTLVSVAGPTHAVNVDRDCGDFATQASAQTFFFANGGPASDPHLLDADGDGVACETLPCPCSDTPAPVPFAAPCSLNPKVTEKAVVMSVVDGDTLTVRIRGSREIVSVRLLGIDTPERKKRGYSSATKSLKNLTPARKKVKLVSDPTQGYEDRYGRILRYVKRGSKDVNKTQLSRGWAKYFDVDTCAALTKKTAYKRAERAAKKANRGLWR